MIYGKFSSFFIRIESRLEKPITSMIQNVVHINTVIKIALCFIQNSYFTGKRRIAFFSSWILVCYKIVQLDAERQLDNFRAIFYSYVQSTHSYLDRKS